MQRGGEAELEVVRVVVDKQEAASLVVLRNTEEDEKEGEGEMMW